MLDIENFMRYTNIINGSNIISNNTIKCKAKIKNFITAQQSLGQIVRRKGSITTLKKFCCVKNKE